MGFKKGTKYGVGIKKGQVLNPNGRPKKFVSEVMMKTGFRPSQINDALMRIIRLDMKELNDLILNEKATILERIIAKAVLKDYMDGEISSLEKVLQRAIGAPTQHIESKNLNIEVQYITLPDGTKIEI